MLWTTGPRFTLVPFYSSYYYSRTSTAQTLMARLPCLTRTRFCVPMIPYMRLLLSNVCIYVFILFFSFSIFSDRRSLKIENENNKHKNSDNRSPISRTKVHRVQLMNIETYPAWLELPLTWTSIHSPTSVWWMDGWVTCDFMSFSTVFQSYQDDEMLIMKGCVQWNPLYGWEDFISSGAWTHNP